jgi:hypothetical protein
LQFIVENLRMSVLEYWVSLFFLFSFSLKKG